MWLSFCRLSFCRLSSCRLSSSCLSSCCLLTYSLSACRLSACRLSAFRLSVYHLPVYKYSLPAYQVSLPAKSVCLPCMYSHLRMSTSCCLPAANTPNCLPSCLNVCDICLSATLLLLHGGAGQTRRQDKSRKRKNLLFCCREIAPIPPVSQHNDHGYLPSPFCCSCSSSSLSCLFFQTISLVLQPILLALLLILPVL
jgi:hypothetical protein